MTYTSRNKGLLSWYIKFNKMSMKLHGKPCTKWFIQNILLISETTADIRLNDTDLTPFNSECLTDNSTYDMRNLSRTYNLDAVSFHLSIADKVFNMTVLNSWCAVPAFYFDQSRFFDRFFIISFTDCCMLENIVRIFFMKLRSILFHSIQNIQNKWIFFIFYFDRTKCLCSGNLILCYNRSDIIPIKSDAVCKYKTIGNILV